MPVVNLSRVLCLAREQTRVRFVEAVPDEAVTGAGESECHERG